MSEELKSCPCGNVGYYVVYNRNTGEAEQEQCEFCYTEPNSVFNAIQKLRSIISELKEDADRLVTGYHRTFDKHGNYCRYCGYSAIFDKHSPDCPITLHRSLMAKLEREEL